MTEVRCPSCQEVVPSGRFCDLCGGSLESQWSPDRPSQEQPEIPTIQLMESRDSVISSRAAAATFDRTSGPADVPGRHDTARRSRSRAAWRIAIVAVVVGIALGGGIVAMSTLEEDSGGAPELRDDDSTDGSVAVTVDAQPTASAPVGAVAVASDATIMSEASGDPIAVSVASCPGLLAFVDADGCTSLDRPDQLFAITSSTKGRAVELRAYSVVTTAAEIVAAPLLKAVVRSTDNGSIEVAVGTVLAGDVEVFVVRSDLSDGTTTQSTVEFFAPVDATTIESRGAFSGSSVRVASSGSTLLVSVTDANGTIRMHTVYPLAAGWRMAVEAVDAATEEARFVGGQPVVWTDEIEVAASATETTSQTTPLTTEPAGDPAVTALASLQTYAASDMSVARQAAGRWVTQLSAKRLGVVWRGVTYGYPEILADHEFYRGRYGTILLDAGDWNFGDGNSDLWVSVLPTPHVTSEEALAFCYQNGFDRGDCFAKQLRTDGVSSGTVDYP